MTPKSREEAACWLFDRTEKYKLCNEVFDAETAACALNFLDRYLSVEKISQQELESVVYASLALAMRIHEDVPIHKVADGKFLHNCSC